MRDQVTSKPRLFARFALFSGDNSVSAPLFVLHRIRLDIDGLALQEGEALGPLEARELDRAATWAADLAAASRTCAAAGAQRPIE
jgi:hypothetical protein